ncbi:MAG TPA: hypothetical protein VGB73_02775 [Pyrinomonadaceae bacterium]|jgi:hypothetical protein
MVRKLKKQTKKRAGRPIFDAIRKPNAPPGHPLARAKPEERAHPAERKVKHKQRDDLPDADE